MAIYTYNKSLCSHYSHRKLKVTANTIQINKIAIQVHTYTST